MQGKKGCNEGCQAMQESDKKDTGPKQGQERRKEKQQDGQKQQSFGLNAKKQQNLEAQGEKKLPLNQHPKPEALDKEIEEIAEQIKEANKKKMIQLNMNNLLHTTQQVVPRPVETLSEDWTSVQGQFGWTEVASSTIPYITRCGEKYVSLRMADMKIFLKYRQAFTEEVRNCFRVNKLPITKAEAQLFNEINFRHCDNYFGRLEFGLKDFIVTLKDVMEMYEFLNFTFVKLVEKNVSPHKRCGFVKISSQNCVPYSWHDGKQYVPLFYFEWDGKYLEERSVELRGWELAYLKLSCKIQGIRKPLYEKDSIRVVDLNWLKRFFPPDTLFEEIWLADANIEALVQKPVPRLVPMHVEQNSNQPQRETIQKKRPGYEKKSPGGQKRPMQVRPTLQKVPTTVETNVPHAGYRTVNSLQCPKPPASVAAPTARPQYVSKPATPSVLLKPISPPSINRSKVLQIPEFVYTVNGCPYFLIRAQVEDKSLNFCINMEPFMTTTLLVTVEEVSMVFFGTPLDLVFNAINVMHLDIFMPNKLQTRCLERAKRCPTRGLVKLKDFIDNLPQIKYILTSIQYPQPS